jgi:hypothetical protein
MRRIFLVLTVVAVMAAMLAVFASAAFADPPSTTGLGSQRKGAGVLHCQAPGLFDKGNVVFTPIGNIGGSGCFS